MNEALCIQLAAQGFTELADELENATTPAEQRRMLECAVHAADGALMVLRRYSRKIGVIHVAPKIRELESLDDVLTKRIAELSATYHLETKP